MNQRMPESKSGALTSWRHPIDNKVGRATRIELTTSRATIWRTNQLSYTRHIMVRLKRFELLTHGLEGRCSIRLSYKRILLTPFHASGRTLLVSKMERVMGIGPTQPAWKAGILPLNYTRIRQRLYILPKIKKKVKCFSDFFPTFFIKLRNFIRQIPTFPDRRCFSGILDFTIVFCHNRTFLCGSRISARNYEL